MFGSEVLKKLEKAAEGIDPAAVRTVCEEIKNAIFEIRDGMNEDDLRPVCEEIKKSLAEIRDALTAMRDLMVKASQQ